MPIILRFWWWNWIYKPKQVKKIFIIVRVCFRFKKFRYRLEKLFAYLKLKLYNDEKKFFLRYLI